MRRIVKLLIRLLNKLNLLEYFNLYTSIILNDYKLKIPLIQKIGLSNLYMSEPWMIDLLKIIMLLREGVFIDIGVNIGQTLLKFKSVSKEIVYLGFEPNPIAFQYCKKLIEVNRFQKVTILPVGVSDKSNLGVLNFFSDSTVDASASMISGFRKEETVIRKEFIPLFSIADLELINLMDDIAILKIDVEGAELEVVKSFYKKIEAFRPIILMEILPTYSIDHSERINRQNELIAMLFKADYCIYRIAIESSILKGFSKLEEIEIHSDLNACEYIMMPKELENDFTSKINQLLAS